MSSTMHSNKSSKSCQEQNDGLVCANDSENSNNSIKFKKTPEKRSAILNDYTIHNESVIIENHEREKTLFKRDVKGKENDPWSIISPVGKY